MLRKSLAFLLVNLLALGAFAKDKTTNDIMRQVDYLQKRHEVLATNIANSNTPKYKARDIEAPDLSNKKRKIVAPRVKMRVTNNRHIKPHRLHSSEKYNIINDNSGAMKPNKNNVDLAKQVSKIAANNDEVSIALKNYRSSMDLISNAADGGHR